MKRLDIGALPVRENNRLVGMITDRDIAVRAVAEGGYGIELDYARDMIKSAQLRLRAARSWRSAHPGRGLRPYRGYVAESV
jgi:CBS domain-containing protein